MKLRRTFIAANATFTALLAHAATTEPQNETTPLAPGLPERVPLSEKRPWEGTFAIKGGVLLKNGSPFFPIGFVFGTDDETLSQVKAMGANAVHFEVGWNVTTGAGPVDEAAFREFTQKIELAGEWGMAAFPLMAGHYVPHWFSNTYPKEGNQPMGSDGNPTGSWTPYSLNFPGLRDNIKDFWREAAEITSKHPNVVSLSLWNEPSYGGTWNKGHQFADYSQWGIANWRKELEAKYSEIGQLNTQYGTKFADWSAVYPPKSPEEFGRKYWLSWMEFGQRSFAGFFDLERSIIKEVAPDLPLVNKKQTNPWDRSSASSGTNWRLLGKSEDIFGINLYSSSPFGSRTILDAASSYAGSKPVMIFEINTMPPNAEARTPDLVRPLLWAPLVGGARGMFIFTLINDPEHGLINDEATGPLGRAEYTRFISNVSTHQRELASPRLSGKIGVIYSTTAALQQGNDVVPEHAVGAFDLFRNSHYQVDFIPEEDIAEDALTAYKLVVIPSFCILKPRELAAIGEYIDKGGRVLAFADTLSTDENLSPTALPQWLGLTTRQSAIGDRQNQRISKTNEKLEPYLDDEIRIGGVELISLMANPGKNLVPGAEIKTSDAGEVIAYNSDSYPAIISTKGGKVIYCAFRSNYSAPLRGLMEGIARELWGLKQEARLVGVESQITDSSLLTGLRTDYQDPNRRYLLVINSQYRPRKIAFDMEDSWKVEAELLHPDEKASLFENWTFAPREVYLFTLVRR